MDDKEINALFDQAMGHALYASTLAELAFMRGIIGIPKQQVAELLDNALLIFERNQASLPEHQAAVEHVRNRLEAFRSVLGKKTPE